ncbi:unnamed protein product, partial [marine sediment metagenome]
RLLENLDDYRDATEKTFELMRNRDSTLQQQLNPQGMKMRKNLTDIMISAFKDKDPEAAYVAGSNIIVFDFMVMFSFLSWIIKTF